jgi:hypothetical protein
MKNLLLEEKGDVPGWVLITLMTAGLVVVIWAFAGPALQGIFDEALDRVGNKHHLGNAHHAQCACLGT